jgi:hypothetical protein
MKKFDFPPPVKLVAGLLYHDEEWLQRALIDLRTEFGDIDYQSAALEFNYTDYYFKEMGEPLFRAFVSFEKLIDPAELSVIKVYTNSLEDRYSPAGSERRVINIDPGYLNATAYILATSKNYSHRIYIGRGIFAQQELLFEKKRITTLDWTYPDYRSVDYQDILRKIRQIYLKQIQDLPEQVDSTRIIL